jgi:hypothetical protein
MRLGKIVPKDEEEREAMFMEDEETVAFCPKYVLTWHEVRATEKWFGGKGHFARPLRLDRRGRDSQVKAATGAE